jgi:hypothetical protein
MSSPAARPRLGHWPNGTTVDHHRRSTPTRESSPGSTRADPASQNPAAIPPHPLGSPSCTRPGAIIASPLPDPIPGSTRQPAQPATPAPAAMPPHPLGSQRCTRPGQSSPRPSDAFSGSKRQQKATNTIIPDPTISTHPPTSPSEKNVDQCRPEPGRQTCRPMSTTNLPPTQRQNMSTNVDHQPPSNQPAREKCRPMSTGTRPSNMSTNVDHRPPTNPAPKHVDRCRPPTPPLPPPPTTLHQ